MAEDYNCINFVRDILSHTARVMAIHLAVAQKWVLSVGRDKMFQLYCSQSGQPLGSFTSEAWCISLQYPYHANILLYTYFSISFSHGKYVIPLLSRGLN